MDLTIPNPKLYGIPFTIDDFNGMPYRNLGSSGLKVSNVGLGTWKFGFPETGDGARVNEKNAFRILDRAIELGVTFWDTANRYNASSGNSERVIGKWIKNIPGIRRNVVIATKMYGSMDGLSPNHCRLSRTNVLESVYASLERLQLEYVDILYFHNFDATTPLEESLAAVEDLIVQDLVRYFAVSNFTVEQLKRIDALSSASSVRCKVLAVQNQYDILSGERTRFKGVLEYAGERGLSFIAWSPLALGLLTERYLDRSQVSDGDRLYDEGVLDAMATQEAMKTVSALADKAHAWGLKLNELVLNYMLTLPAMGPVIPSSSSVEQLESNAKAGTIELAEEQKAEIRGILAA